MKTSPNSYMLKNPWENAKIRLLFSCIEPPLTFSVALKRLMSFFGKRSLLRSPVFLMRSSPVRVKPSRWDCSQNVCLASYPPVAMSSVSLVLMNRPLTGGELRRLPSATVKDGFKLGRDW